MEVLRLKELLKEKGISGKDLAAQVGVAENTISFIVTGKTQPRFELLTKIAEALEVDIRDLFIPTKGDTLETIYILKDGQYTPVGKLSLEKDK
ncbi:helix-turn-helix transcriptional regulator [Xanthomarina gelatinilytica]|uniref:helix-turn-helix transcriptional regulator n=1 Tax=Xanthomarina gelatinilytica TaxID=1137281 RepID=UPI003AA90581